MHKLKKSSDHTFCCVPQYNLRACKELELCFHRIPSSKNMKQDNDTLKRRKEWIRVLRIGKEVGHYMKVCSKHFKKTGYIFPDVTTKRPHLKSTAIPSLNLSVLSTENIQVMAEKRKRADERHERCNTIIHLDFTSDKEGTLSEDTKARNATTEDQPQFLNLLHSLKDKSTQVSSGDFVTQILIPSNKLSSKQLNSLTGLHLVKLLEQLTEYVQMELQSAPK
ncbi:hypothetical protein X975_05302, partial [Stegodyphus mimosarum]